MNPVVISMDNAAGVGLDRATPCWGIPSSRHRRTQELEVAYSPAVDLHLIAQIQSFTTAARPRVPVVFRSVVAEKLAERLFEGTSHAAIGILPVEDDIAKAC